MEIQEKLDQINTSDLGLRLTAPSDPPEHWVIIHLSGYLDTDNSHIFGKMILELDLTNSTGLALDLRELQYISSTGVGVLSNILVESKRRQFGFVLLGIQEKVRKVLSLLGFEKFFTILDGKDDLD